MVVSYKTSNKIKFPVYLLASSNWMRQDGLLFLDGEIVDDRNMSGDTLGIRRIQTPHKNLHKLNKQVNDFRGLVKSNHKTFIDTNGTTFIYEKTEFCKLKYYRIKSITKKEICCLLYLQGIKRPFIIPRPPAEEVAYAGVIHYHNIPWILYNYSETKLKDTRRKV